AGLWAQRCNAIFTERLMHGTPDARNAWPARLVVSCHGGRHGQRTTGATAALSHGPRPRRRDHLAQAVATRSVRGGAREPRPSARAARVAPPVIRRLLKREGPSDASSMAA